MHELVAMLHDGDLTVPCAKVEEEANGVHLLDDDGERIAYIPYDHLEYVLPKEIASKAPASSSQSSDASQSDDTSQPDTSSPDSVSAPHGKDPKRRDPDD